MSETLEMVFIAEWRLAGGMRGLHKESGCSALGVSHSHLPLWAAQEVTWGGLGSCQGSGDATRRFGDNERCGQRCGHGWCGCVCGTNTLRLPPSLPLTP